MNEKSIKLCSGQNCCPTLKLINDNTIEITDDNENIVYITVEQAKLIANALLELGV